MFPKDQICCLKVVPIILILDSLHTNKDRGVQALALEQSHHINTHPLASYYNQDTTQVEVVVLGVEAASMQSGITMEHLNLEDLEVLEDQEWDYHLRDCQHQGDHDLCPSSQGVQNLYLPGIRHPAASRVAAVAKLD